MAPPSPPSCYKRVTSPESGMRVTLPPTSGFVRGSFGHDPLTRSSPPMSSKGLQRRDSRAESLTRGWHGLRRSGTHEELEGGFTGRCSEYPRKYTRGPLKDAFVRKKPKAPLQEYLTTCADLGATANSAMISRLTPDNVRIPTPPYKLLGDGVISLRDTYLGERGFIALLPVLDRNTKWYELDVSNNGLRNEAVLHLVDFLLHPRHRDRAVKLDLSRNPISQMSADALNTLVEERGNIVGINLSFTKIPRRAVLLLQERIRKRRVSPAAYSVVERCLSLPCSEASCVAPILAPSAGAVPERVEEAQTGVNVTEVSSIGAVAVSSMASINLGTLTGASDTSMIAATLSAVVTDTTEAAQRVAAVAEASSVATIACNTSAAVTLGTEAALRAVTVTDEESNSVAATHAVGALEATEAVQVAAAIAEVSSVPAIAETSTVAVLAAEAARGEVTPSEASSTATIAAASVEEANPATEAALVARTPSGSTTSIVATFPAMESAEVTQTIEATEANPTHHDDVAAAPVVNTITSEVASRGGDTAPIGFVVRPPSVAKRSSRPGRPTSAASSAAGGQHSTPQAAVPTEDGADKSLAPSDTMETSPPRPLKAALDVDGSRVMTVAEPIATVPSRSSLEELESAEALKRGGAPFASYGSRSQLEELESAEAVETGESSGEET